MQLSLLHVLHLLLFGSLPETTQGKSICPLGWEGGGQISPLHRNWISPWAWLTGSAEGKSECGLRMNFNIHPGKARQIETLHLSPGLPEIPRYFSRNLKTDAYIWISPKGKWKRKREEGRWEVAAVWRCLRHVDRLKRRRKEATLQWGEEGKAAERTS